HIYFYLEFSEPMEWEAFLNDKSQKDVRLKDNYYGGKNVKAIFRSKNGKKPLMVKVGISNVSVEGAKNNLQTEAPGWDFETYKKNAADLWEKELSKIQVTSTDKDKLSVFYTALYHAMVHPSIANDVDGSYRGRDMKIHKTEGHDYYSVFSLWDTYRGLHPLLTLIDKKRTEDFIKTFLLQYEQGGRLPVWELASNETECMIGYHSVSVISDAYMKGIRGFDAEKALIAMKASAMKDHFGLAAYKQNNVITIDDEPESVSRTLEYAYDDWCIAQVARDLKKEEDYNTFIKRAQSWKNVYNKETGFMRARKNGNWQSPFDPREVNNYFTEANSWQYSFYVPQDVESLIALQGGKKGFEQKLDALFTANSKTTGRTQDDISGLIGQYAHGNEPSHHMVYLYNYTGNYSKTVKYIDTICNYFYKNTPDGLIGNEDCGQMSAWYVLSSLGIFQVCPGSTDFVIGKPQFEKAVLTTHNNNKLTLSRPGNYTAANANNTVFKLNKKDHTKLFISYNDILNGGSLEFITSPGPITGDYATPSSKIADQLLVPIPAIKTSTGLFDDTLRVTLVPSSNKSDLYYRTETNGTFIKYKEPFIINKTTEVEAYEEVNGTKSTIAKGMLHKRPNKWKVSIKYKYNPQYNAGGAIGIIDGLRADVNWKKGGWQGYQSTDFEATVDMLEVKNISYAGAEFLQDTRSWILFPTQLVVYTSSDGINFEKAVTINNKKPADDYEIQLLELSGEMKPTKARYVKFVATNFGKLPEWHAGKGDDAFIFVDELIIK
ncbi:MAG TPA: GH92 family glycosyl hydrolase, partial [Bacteroidia bacterium]